MVKILREVDTEPVPKVAKRHGVSEQTIYAWRKRYGELDVADMRRLRELEKENARLKKMVAERDLEIDVVKEIAKKVVSVRARRRQVAYATRRGLSQRRACRLLSVARAELGFESRLAKLDAPVLEAMRKLARQYPRYGYRRIQVFLARRGFEMSPDRAYRPWRQAAYRFLGAGRGGELPPVDVDRRRPPRLITFGRSTSSSTDAPTLSNSSA